MNDRKVVGMKNFGFVIFPCKICRLEDSNDPLKALVEKNLFLKGNLLPECEMTIGKVKKRITGHSITKRHKLDCLKVCSSLLTRYHLLPFIDGIIICDEKWVGKGVVGGFYSHFI